MYCPTCAMLEPWVAEVSAAFSGLQSGMVLADVAAEPTAALVEAVTLLSAEVDARGAARARDRR